jgi:NAD(P)-binding Rossmann-like domain
MLSLVCATCIAALPEPPTSKTINWNPSDIITRDICVVGGGASGTYAALRLGDMSQSVVIVERTNRLGGHTETFTDPATKAKIDIGVVVWHDLDVVRNFFSRFDVPLTKGTPSSPNIVQTVVDFRTGKAVTGLTPSDPTAALGAYAAQLAKYPYLEAGFDLPNPVPADLLLPFSDFVAKYGLSGAVNIIFSFNQGIGNLLSTPTLYVMKLFGLGVLQGIQSGFLVTERHDNSEVYEKAQAALSSADSLLLSSHIVATKRDATGVKVLVSTPSGPKVIKAKKILLTIPPSLENLAPLDLDNTERSLFKQFSATGYYTGLLRHSGIPDNTSIQNIGTNTPFNLPPLPGIYGLFPTGVPGLQKVL